MMNPDRTTPLWDAGLPDEERIGWLLANLTVEEKLTLIAGGGGADIPRLGIPGIGVGGEAAHGMQARNDWGDRSLPPDVTTCFTQPIGMCATWDPEIMRLAGEVTGIESRVLAKKRPGHHGLSRWAPTVDIERDPRWGRTEEAYGEDPYLIGEMAGAYVRGMRGDDPHYIRVAATLKHFYANNTERGRSWKNTTIDPRNKYELYLEPFRRVIQNGGAEGVMTAYNRVNGLPGIVNPDVKDILKKQYGVRHVVGDGGAMELVVKHAHQFGMHAETLAAALKAGVDSMSDEEPLVYDAAKEALDLGLITEEDLDRAIANVMKTKLRLGIYDAPGSNPFDDVTDADVCSARNSEICRTMSREAMVLLKNDGMLPLTGVKEEDVALIGPLADVWHQDWYCGEPPERVTIRDGLRALLGDAAYCDGHDRVTFSLDGKPFGLDEQGNVRLCDTPEVFIKEDWGEGIFTLRSERTGLYWATNPGMVSANASPVQARNKAIFSWFNDEIIHIIDKGDGKVVLTSRFDVPAGVNGDGVLVSGYGVEAAALEMTVVQSGAQAAAKLAAQKKVVVLALGCQPMVCCKEEVDRGTIALPSYQQALMDAVTGANPNTALVLMTNYPYAFHTNARAVLLSATGAQDMGHAVAETLLGHNAPAGRLNMTWYESDEALPSIDDYDIIGGKRTYRYFDGPVLYPFGHGLTYANFAYENMDAELEDDVIRVRFDVKNTGSVTSDEVAQVYAAAPASRVKKPIRQLVGFTRLHDIAPGETRHVRIDVPVEELRFYDVIGRRLMVEAGRYAVMAGRSSADLPLRADVDVPGGTTGLRDMGERTAADHYDEYDNMLLTLGQYGFSAAAVADEVRPGELVYRDVDAATLTGALTLHMMSARGCRVEVMIGGEPAGEWSGDTADYNPAPLYFMIDDEGRALEKKRVAIQHPVFANVRIPLNAKASGSVTMTLRVTGDAKICWLRCEKK